jgi:polar amino acid transport system substrate-binding protein
VAPGWARAARPPFTMATGALAPLPSAPGRVGFLDLLAQEVFGRIGVDATVLRLPVERALVNANAGIEDGDMFRAAGFEKDYPNLVQVPEKVLDFDFIADTIRADLQVHDWSDLAPYSVGHVTGWKILERRVTTALQVTTVRALDQLFPLLATRRADVLLLDRWQGLWLAREAGLAVRQLTPPLARADVFICLHRRHEALVAPLAVALAAAKRDGTWQAIYDRALKPMEPAG